MKYAYCPVAVDGKKKEGTRSPDVCVCQSSAHTVNKHAILYSVHISGMLDYGCAYPTT